MTHLLDATMFWNPAGGVRRYLHMSALGAATELAKEWRTDRALRRLDARDVAREHAKALRRLAAALDDHAAGPAGGDPS